MFLLFAGAFYVGVMGGGDVKLAGGARLWFPPAGTVKLIVLMSIAGGVLTLARLGAASLRRTKRAVPKFRTASPSRSADCGFSPNAFLTNLPDV